MTHFAPRSSLRLAGVLLALGGIAGCGTLPVASNVGGAAPPDVTWLNPPVDTTSAAAGKVLIKVKDGQAIRSIQGLRQVQSITGLNNTSVYSVPSGSTVAATVAKLRQDPSVAYAEPDYLYHATALHTEATVNDPDFNQLWGIQKIQAPAAWETTTGDPNVVVAVVDTGVDYNHPDLQGQIIKGPNLVANTSDPMDDQGHGSHVAGTIAAVGNNGVGVVGIAYHTKVLAIKVLGSDGSGDTATIAQGILKAQELGAKVINMSLGGPQDSQALHDAVTQVTQKGTLCVVAGGNDGTTGNDYPAAYPESLAVGATDQNDTRTSFSNYGSDIAIAAPGLNILSTTGGDYKQESGTSMASPHVAGAAALLLAKNPNLTPAQIKDALTQNGDPVSGGFPSGVERLNVAKALAAVTGTSAPAPSSPVPAAGDTQAPTVPTGLKALAASSTQVQLNWNPSSDNVGVAGYRVYRNGTLLATTTSASYSDSGLSPGTGYAYTVAAYDAAGNVSPQCAPSNVQMPSSDTQLTISHVALQNLTRTGATVGWTSRVAADSRIDFTASNQYFLGWWLNIQSATSTTAHSLTMSGLTPGGTYYLKITSVDASGNRVTAGLYGLRMPK